jgi:hypothetical protein
VPNLFWDHGRKGFGDLRIGVFLTMHLWRENTRMQIRWATGSLLEPSDDFFGFFLVRRTWRKYGEMDVSVLRYMCPWHWCTYFLSAVQHIFPADLVYSKGLANRSSICFLLSFSSPYLGIDSVCISALLLTLAQSSTDFRVPNICQIHWIQPW